MKVMILATGAGTRLRLITNKIPKALVKISGKTIQPIFGDSRFCSLKRSNKK